MLQLPADGRNLQDGQLAFWGCGWVAFLVSAVVVFDMVLLHPLHLVDLVLVQSLLSGTWGSITACLACLDGIGTGYGTPIHGEVGVCCDEGSRGPVELHGTSLCRPWAPIPDAAVDAHWLLVGEWLSVGFVVGEASDGYIVHKEAANTKAMNNDTPKSHRLYSRIRTHAYMHYHTRLDCQG